VGGRNPLFKEYPVAIPEPVFIMTVHCTTKQGYFSNVSYWEASTPPTTSSNVDAMCAAAAVILAPLYSAVMNFQAKFQGITAIYKASPSEVVGSDSTHEVDGTLATAKMSDQNAVVIRKLTGMAGRQNQGRFFVGGLDAAIVDTNAEDEIDPGDPLTAFRAIASAYGADMNMGYSVCHARHWNRRDNILQPITECRVSSRIASRRDRRRHAYNLPL
jgi:hypothetical protein